MLDERQRRIWQSLLSLAGRTQRDIARELGVHGTLVGKVIAGERANARVRAALAEAIDMSVEDAWGEQAPTRLALELRHRLEAAAMAQVQATFADVVCSSGASDTRAA